MRQKNYKPKKAGAYGGVTGLQLSTKMKLEVIKEWLSHQDTYTLHKAVHHRFKRRPIIFGGIDHLFQADLIDMRNLKNHNNGFAYLVTFIDVFNKFASVIPLKTKT